MRYPRQAGVAFALREEKETGKKIDSLESSGVDKGKKKTRPQASLIVTEHDSKTSLLKVKLVNWERPNSEIW